VLFGGYGTISVNKKCFPKKGWNVLQTLNPLFDRYEAVLAGGTALALRIGHRISVDLDFFTATPFRVDTIISEIKKTGYKFQILSEGPDHLTANVEGVKVSIFHYEYSFPDKIDIYNGTRIAGLLDIASMKVIAANQRGTKRDFIDIYFILQIVPFHKIARHMVNRFGKDRINPVHIGKSLVYFADAESNPDPEYLKGKSVKWQSVKKFFRDHVRQIVLDLDAAVKADAGSSL
jgi:hypothetical protein